MSKSYDINDYIKIHNCVIAYQNNSSNSTALIESFKPFLQSYLNLLCEGTFNVKNKSTYKFICLYNKLNPDVYYTEQSIKYKSKTYSFLLNTVKYIVDLYSHLDKEELYNELICIFLTMAKRYKDTKPSFHNYIDKCFHFEVYRHLNTLLYKDDINIINEEYHISDDVIDNLNIYYNLKNTNVKIKQDVGIIDDRFINYNWILGITCNDVFSKLTIFERSLIYQYYIKNKYDKNIAYNYGLHRVTINIKRNNLKDKLKKLCIKNNLIKG